MVQENNYSIQNFDKEVLREYDIRGIVGDKINENTAYTIGRTFGYAVNKKLNSNIITTGYDGRITSPALQQALCEGLKDSGAKVINIGMGPTPMTYFAHYHLNADAAIMVTGSHNPSEYNGFKMVFNKNSFFAEDIQSLQKIIDDNVLKLINGQIINQDITKDYIDRVLLNININRELKIAWDPGNGAMGKVIRQIVNKLSNTKNIIINEEVDGTFPNHHPDPTVPKNMLQLIESVKNNNCDIGLAFDGDGDRLGVIDNKGSIVWADQYMLLLCKEIASLYENPKIIMDVKCSKVFFDEAKKINCDPIMSRTGHSPIKEKMKELNSPLSGEMSGHVCYSDDFYGYDDAMYVGLRLLRILANQNNTLSDLIGVYPKTYSTPETRFDVDESRKFIIIDEVKERLKKLDNKIIDIDGVRVENNDGWFLVRASNTQNQLTCRAESISKTGLQKLISIIEYQLSLSGVIYKFMTV
ncbi:phosphomannomutase/phosphoglucomutase [Alphaproteobacteria bacterium]|nr:phosphomannomutase/phosphoglucomutase [Alphaproteobacteria bacterium]